VARVGLELRDRADLDETALLDHRDTISERTGFAQIVRDKEDGATTFGKKLAQPGDQFVSECDVDVRERLIEQEGPRFSHESARERHALALASREMRSVQGAAPPCRPIRPGAAERRSAR
jgi:hypothetical protein